MGLVALGGRAFCMIDAKLRHVKERALTPLARLLRPYLSPLTITLLGGLLGVGAAVAAGLRLTEVGLALWVLNRLLDGLDGTLARVQQTQSDLGGYLDIMTDFLVYALIPIGLFIGTPSAGNGFALAVMLATFYVNAGSFLYLSALLERRLQGAKTRGELTSIAMPNGLIEGAETVVFYGLFFLFPTQLSTLMLVFACLVVVSTAQRVVWALRHL